MRQKILINAILAAGLVYLVEYEGAGRFKVSCIPAVGEELREVLKSQEMPRSTDISGDGLSTEEIGNLENEDRLSERNPFLFSQEAISKQNRQVIDTAMLTGTFISPSFSYAIIDGRVAKIGDSIDGKEIIDIDCERIILKDLMGEYVIFLNKK